MLEEMKVFVCLRRRREGGKVEVRASVWGEEDFGEG